MKRIMVYFEDAEMELLKEEKGKLSWHDFIMELTKRDENNEV